MRSLKPIIISLAVIVVLVGVYLLMVFVFPESNDAETETEPSAAVTSETVYIIKENYEDLASFEMIPEEGESMSVAILPPENEDSAQTYDVYPESKYFTYNPSLLRSMTYTVTSMTAKGLVEEDAKDLSAYGLDHPNFTLRTTYKDGRVIELYLGKDTLVDGNVYCMTNQSNAVYTLGSYVASLLRRTPLEYMDITLFPTYTDDDIYANINWVRMTQRDGTVIEIQLDTDGNLDGNTAASSYVMLSPTSASGNSETIKSKVLDVVAPIAIITKIKDLEADEYAEYGFDNPAKLEMTDIDGNTMSLLVGNVCPNTDYTYVMLEGTPTLMTCYTSCFTWLDINYLDLMIRTIWYYNITDVKSIAYTVDGTDYFMDLSFSQEETTDGTTESVLSATLNGEEISSVNARRLYVRTLNFRAVANAPADALTAKPEISITINMLNGQHHTLNLIPLNERQFAAEVDGKAEFYVYLKNLTTLRNAFKTILDGDELEFSFES